LFKIANLHYISYRLMQQHLPNALQSNLPNVVGYRYM